MTRPTPPRLTRRTLLTLLAEASRDGAWTVLVGAGADARYTGYTVNAQMLQAAVFDGIADIAANKVAMFRTAAKTAALAATLPQTAER